jgi:hypothetical protein
MNGRRLIAPCAVLGAWLATLHSAAAHRVDEYLQATRLSVDVERVDLEIDLTAGFAVASRVFAWIDTNRDGEVSQAEGEAYAQQVLRSLVLKVDGRPVPIRLVETSFPEFRAMSLGVGTIRLRATAKVPPAGAGHHQIYFLNTHRTDLSVYLVNALVPANPRIQLADPRRDRAQLGLTLDYTIGADAASGRTPLLITALMMAACLLWRWSRAALLNRDAVRRGGRAGPAWRARLEA